MQKGSHISAEGTLSPPLVPTSAVRHPSLLSGKCQLRAKHQSKSTKSAGLVPWGHQGINLLSSECFTDEPQQNVSVIKYFHKKHSQFRI